VVSLFRSWYSLHGLIDTLSLTTLLRDESLVPEAIIHSLHLSLPSSDALSLAEKIRSKSIQFPSAATVSRAHIKIEVLHCLWRQHTYRLRGLLEGYCVLSSFERLVFGYW
jgi:hypothetical protein